MRTIPTPEGVDLSALEWRVCHATEDYEVSEYGDVRRLTPGRKTFPGKIPSFCWHRAGYPRFKLTINGKHEHFEAHRLEAFSFLSPPEAGQTDVAHRDGNPTNNHHTNRSWKTHLENERDKIEHGTLPSGARNGASKLDDESVVQIRAMRVAGSSHSEIGQRFGVAFQTISKIVNRQSWSHIQ